MICMRNVASLECMILMDMMWHPQSIMVYLHCSTADRRAVVLQSARQTDQKEKFQRLMHHYDRGPVFFKQARLTQDGREFGIIKFRSMCIESEKNGAQLAKKHDDRITPVGRLIRKIHFDEIPQLFNILKGDMSIVGPRPERQEIASQYEEIIPEFRYRLKVKAGLTGYAQVYGKYNTTPYDKLKLDMLYIENYSFWLDIKILLMTFKVILQKENSEGIDENQITALKREIESKTTTKY